MVNEAISQDMTSPASEGSYPAAHSVSSETEWFRARARLCLIVFLASFLPRFVFMTQSDPYISDQYWEIAQSLVKTGDYAVHRPTPQGRLDFSKVFFEQDQPTACRGPLTPLYLALCQLIFGESIVGIRLLSVFICSCANVLVLLTLLKMGASPRAAIVAGLIWSFWPPAIMYSTYAFLSEPITQISVLLILYLMAPGSESTRISPVPLGFVFGTAVLNRSELLIFILGICAYTLLVLRYRLKSILIALFVCAAIVSPWIVRNYFMVGKAGFSTLDGLVLYIGNNPFTRGSFCGDFHSQTPITNAPSMQWVTERYPDIWDVGEVERSDYFKKAAIGYLKTTMKSDPGHFFWLYMRKIMVYWHARDDSRSQSLPDFLMVQAVLFAFGASLLLPSSKRTYFLAVPMLCCLIVAMIFFASSRNRFPYESGMIMFLVMQWQHCAPRLRGMIARFSRLSA